MRLKRTHYCGELTEKEINKEVILNGWVHSRRDHGGVIFIDLRDISGIVQIVFSQEINQRAHEIAEKLRSEYVIAVKGVVVARTPDTVNPKIPTGKIEVKVNEIEILNKSLTPPFEVNVEKLNIGEEHRLEYRYIDLRREPLKKAVITRHKFTQNVRKFLNGNGFLEIETPILTKSTPEGARDFLIPSRLNPGKFYALPQSPQLFKQILMISGFDKYYQIARCFRDEDLRKDRQPEFTQIDMEMSFIDENDIYNIIEQMFQFVLKQTFDIEIEIPFKRINYKEALERYGSDKPDLRYDLQLQEVTEIAGKTEFKVFLNAIEKKGIVKCLKVKEGAKLSRKEIEDLTNFVSIYGAKGLAWIKFVNSNAESPIVKFFPKQVWNEFMNLIKPENGDIVFFVADKPEIVNDSLANLRRKLAEKFNLIDENKLEFVWIYNFPLLEYSEEEKRYVSKHHPFTHPKLNENEIGSVEELIDKLKKEPEKLYARSYDLVLNGTEIGGGSIRIHNKDLQIAMFKALQLNEEQINNQFGFLIRALEYGAPPHGGIAFGLDRILMIFLKQKSIRDVIPFPKTQKGVCLLTDSPSFVEPSQLKELHIRLEEE